MKSTIKMRDYDNFRCIAGKCSLTCCQEWRILVDDQTADKWQGVTLKNEEKAEISLCQCMKKEANGHVITLNEEKKCPFLNQEKLCKLVIGLGESFLSETCTTFPRQINKFEDRTEYSLAACCPVVVDLFHDKTPLEFVVEGEMKKDIPYVVREMMLSIIKDEDYSLTERMMMIFYRLLELLEMKQKITPEQVHLASKELPVLGHAIRNMAFNPLESCEERNELFLDVVQNYRQQKLYVSFLEPIARVAEGLENDYTEEALMGKIEAFEQLFEDYEGLLTGYVSTEIFGNTLMQDMGLEDLVIAFEWIALEYATIKQALFLKWIESGEGELAYPIVRDYISVIARVTGYDQSDIREYLENSFASVIWEWGYLALILGNE